MFVKDLPIGRRFQLQRSGPVFMRVELKKPVSNSNIGVPVLRLDKGAVFCLKNDTKTVHIP
jgi:hypothetical protein